ncbi:putative transporter MCH4 [Rhizoctonia solani AG-1 IB]|uniref:Putative transporter MCH4 n=1 Tax=Thanatephorus cucumeris (strain AG1-IB / isolate 7/3/14) TaxID=1108050 RepID=M5C069_THACB|nr:putative transporter MCH4 [Rhizoctonia solani AG-1 IB]
MTTPLNAYALPNKQGRDWDSQTVGDSDPDPNNTIGEKTIQQTENAISRADRPADEFVEGGVEGWKVVLGCALIAGPSIGWNLIWGVFQKYHAQHFLVGTPGATLSVIGSLQNAIMMALAFVTGKFGDRYGYKKFIAAGCLVVFLGQLLAAFCDSLWSIFLTQGVLQGIGCGLLLPMIFALPSQWFKKRRGVATGFVIAGSSFGAGVPALIVQAMLDRIGFRKTLLIYSFVQAVTMLLGFLLIKVRPSASAGTEPAREVQWFDKKYLSDPMFWSCWTALFFALL